MYPAVPAIRMMSTGDTPTAHIAIAHAIGIQQLVSRYKSRTMPRPLEFDDRNKLFRFASSSAITSWRKNPII